MSVSALTVITEAAEAVGDPAFSRIARPEWRSILNASCRDLARKLKVVLWAATFDIVADDEYATPSDCIQIKSLSYNPTPSDPTTWYWLREKFEDEFRSMTHGAYPSGTPTAYFARTDTFHLLSKPDTAVEAGGKMIYWGLPDDVTDETTQGIPVMDTLRDTMHDRMVTRALRRLEKFDAAEKREQEWQASLNVDREQLEDRSADRRARIRPRSATSRWVR